MAEDNPHANYPGGPLAPDPQMNVIGGTHHVSTKIDPARAERGEYTPINGDSMPSGTPVNPAPSNQPFLPKN